MESLAVVLESIGLQVALHWQCISYWIAVGIYWIAIGIRWISIEISRKRSRQSARPAFRLFPGLPPLNPDVFRRLLFWRL